MGFLFLKTLDIFNLNMIKCILVFALNYHILKFHTLVLKDRYHTLLAA